ncbi:acylamino-acid-releasing enzyme, partial [Biomphalaria pfeifferi]
DQTQQNVIHIIALKKIISKMDNCEQHGYRKAETIQTSLDEEFYFVGKVLGFEPAEKHRK